MSLLGTRLLVVADAALGIWLGSIVFFSFIGAPTTFDVLDGYARWVLIPKMEKAGDDAFAQYHKQSILLNGVTVLAVAGGIVAIVAGTV